MVLYARGEPEKIRQLRQYAKELDLEIVFYSDLPLQDNVVSGITNLPTPHARQRGIRLRHTVEACGYEWTYKGGLERASCPSCTRKVDVRTYEVS